ncbi:MAG TPA: DNA polymerase III subunit delta' [Dehalococcoidia bacterium]|nr:DNA polymerase III subunit delta' [Dehalococcoidia bacterium]
MTWGLAGNRHVVAALRRTLAGRALAHAYLFAGPEHVGKGTLALRLAQALNCTGEGRGAAGTGATGRSPLPLADSPCGACEPCRRIAGGLHADVQTVAVEPSEEGPQHKAISVGQVREVERAVALNPFEGRWRVVIIDPADAMTAEAQNAFLKTLEEPPAHVVFVLVTAHPERLLPTVRSRCRRLEFRLLSATAVEEALRGEGVEPERASLLARLSRGRVGWALAIARDPAQMERRREALASARALAAMSVDERMGLAERLAGDFHRDRGAVLSLLGDWLDWWRDVLLIQSGAEEGAANHDLLGELREDARRCPQADVQGFVRALILGRRHLEENTQPRLALEALVLEAPRAAGAAARR